MEFIRNKSEKGAATILMVSLVGLALAACLFAVASSVKGDQDTTLMAHQLIQSRAISWKLAGAWTSYLQQIYCGPRQTCQSDTGIASVVGLGVGAKYTMSVASNASDPINQSVATVAGNTFSTTGPNTNSIITLNITSQSNQSSSTVQAMYSLSDSSSGKFSLVSARYQ